MNKDEKGFEAKIRSISIGKGCTCQMSIIEKKESAIKTVICKKCGKVFKTDRNTILCFSCEKG